MSYSSLPGFLWYYLEDSFVTGIKLSGKSLTFFLEAVLTPDHPEYVAPDISEMHCYRNVSLSFHDISYMDWVKFSPVISEDAHGAVDFGNIDSLTATSPRYRLAGDWGVLELESRQPKIELI